MNVAADQSAVSSFWVTSGARRYPQLDRDLATEVVVVGGGIVGLTVARMLQAAGKRVILLESRRVGQQVTGGSTAKVTSQHSLIYRHLTDTFGTEIARTYGEANQWAIEEIAGTVESLQIDCSFVRRPAYVFTADPDRQGEFEDEAAIAQDLGLPARFTLDVPLPLEAAAAVVFDHQAQFDPYAYLVALAADFVDAGGSIFEQTRVTGVEEQAPSSVTTEQGTVSAEEIIIATNLPIIDRGGYFARTVPKAHLVLAAPVNDVATDGMFISVDEPTHSVRWEQRADGLRLILAGPKFQPGSEDTARGFEDLEVFARRHFAVRSVDHRWWNEDFYSVDRMPYVGRFSEDTPHLYLATGFSGWGLTNGVVAARILADTVTGGDHAWAAAFDSTRPILASESPLTSGARLVKENLATAKAFVADRLFSPGPSEVSALRPGDGTVIQFEDERVAVSRDAEGGLHAVSAFCTHLGCVLDWNQAMATWDCGCHGSCFTADGAVLRGPAVEDLAPFLERIAPERPVT